MKNSKTFKKIASLIMATVMTTLVLAGCGTKTSTGDTAKKEYKIAWYASAPHPYFEEVKKGVEAFEKDYAITVEKQIGPDWKQASESENMEALAGKGIKYFSVYPSDPSAANGLFEELTAKGMKVINFGASTVQPTTASFSVQTDVKKAAMAATEYVIKQMGEKGNIINVLEVLEDPNTKLRKEGVEEVVAKYPNVKIIQEVAGMKSAEEAVEKVENALSANTGKVNGVIATGFVASVGLAQALTDIKEKGSKDVIYSVGIDTDPIVIKAIKDGNMTATIAQNPYGHGYLSCLLLKYLADGWTPKAGVYFVNAGFAVVSKDNIDTYSKDIDKVTQEIKGTLETVYLEKK